MSFDIKGIMAGLAKSIADVVPHRVSTTGSGFNKLPSVFIANSLPPKPKLPYATLLHTGTLSDGMTHRASYYSEEAHGYVYEHDRIVTININVYGGVDDDTSSIAEELKARISMPSGMDLLFVNTSCQLFDISDVSLTNVKKSTSYEEVASVRIRVATTVSYTDASTTSIESTTVEGTIVQSHTEGNIDGTSIEADVSAPT